jgi:RIO1 family
MRSGRRVRTRAWRVDRYVSGDFRFRNGYCKANPRKMVKVWAEKEMRNLVRMRQAGIRCPRPLLLRMHVLVMEFVGEDAVAAPRLKDANLPESRLRTAYTELVLTVRALYQECHLVHADLSEYNILVHKVCPSVHRRPSPAAPSTAHGGAPSTSSVRPCAGSVNVFLGPLVPSWLPFLRPLSMPHVSGCRHLSGRAAAKPAVAAGCHALFCLFCLISAWIMRPCAPGLASGNFVGGGGSSSQSRCLTARHFFGTAR